MTEKKLLILGMVMAMIGVLFVATAPVGAQQVPTCGGLEVTIWGDAGNNRIVGTSGRDVIHGLGGRDRIFGGGGGDVICGGDGIDVIKGQKGADWIDGGNGRDRISGGQGSDTVIGGRGNDRVLGGFGNDTLFTGPGEDLVRGGAGIDSCDFDKQDVYGSCETGDVRGTPGFGDGDIAFELPTRFRVSTYQEGGQTVPVYVLDMFVTRDGGPGVMVIDVVDRRGESLFFLEVTGEEYREEVLVLGEPAFIRVGGTNGGYHDITFEAKSVIPVIRGDVEGSGSGVFIFRPAIQPGETSTVAVTPFAGESTNLEVVSIVPGQAPILDIEDQVTEFSEYVGEFSPGSTVSWVRASNADWQILFD